MTDDGYFWLFLETRGTKALPTEHSALQRVTFLHVRDFHVPYRLLAHLLCYFPLSVEIINSLGEDLPLTVV